jgi:hypothetical protein
MGEDDILLQLETQAGASFRMSLTAAQALRIAETLFRFGEQPKQTTGSSSHHLGRRISSNAA